MDRYKNAAFKPSDDFKDEDMIDSISFSNENEMIIDSQTNGSEIFKDYNDDIDFMDPKTKNFQTQAEEIINLQRELEHNFEDLK